MLNRGTGARLGLQKLQECALARVGYYEGWTDLLLNLRTGESTDIDDDPLFSPDGLRFAVVKEDGFTDRNTFSVHSVTANKVRREFFEEMFGRSVKNVKWLGKR